MISLTVAVNTILSLPYYAFLHDDTQNRFMSLKDILQSFIDHYKSTKANISDDDLCLMLLKYKDYPSSRMTRPHSES